MTLPTPDPAFRWSVEPWGHTLRCRPLESIAQHLFTIKQPPLRPSTSSGRPEALEGRSEPRTWAQAAASLGAGLDQLRNVKQVHGSSIRVLLNEGTKARDLMWNYGNTGELWGPVVEDPPDADAIVSNQAGLVLAVQVADCVPILLADKKGGAAGAVHAGWRGTKEGIVEKVVDAMFHEFGTDPGDLIVAIGPSIGSCCYEVGDDVFEAFRGSRWLDHQFVRWFSRTDTGSLRLDLWAATRDQLRSSGVTGDHIHVANLCTQTHSDIFESFRAAGPEAGRMGALVRCKGARVRGC